MTTPKSNGSRPWDFKRAWLAVLLLVVLAVVTGIRIRLLGMPLERDEGEYAYAGQLLLKGLPPYGDVYTMKWPGTFAAFALFMEIFGQTARGIHAGLILVNLTTAVLVLVLGKRVCGSVAGVVAAATYATLSISPSMLGLAAHANHFVLPFALGGLLLIQKTDEQTRMIRFAVAGSLLGLAALMKQSGAVFGLFAALWIVRQETLRSRNFLRGPAVRLAWFAFGGLLPVALTFLLFAWAGEFDSFWFWTVKFAHVYSTIITPATAIQTLALMVARLFLAAPGLWSAAGLGLVLLFLERSLRGTRFFVAGFTVFSALGVSLGWYFRHHYFLLLLPATGLLVGIAVEAATRLIARRRATVDPATLPLVLFAAAVAWSLIQERAILFSLPPERVVRAIYGENPFPEAVEVGRYLKSHCSPDARIAVLGSEPEIFFYSHRRSATGYIYIYPLMESQPYAAGMQKEMIQEIEKANPEYVIYVHVFGSFLELPNSVTLIFDWFDQYQQEQLQKVGLVDIGSADQTEYHWIDSQGVLPQPRSDYWLAVFKKRPPPSHGSSGPSNSQSPRSPSVPK